MSSRGRGRGRGRGGARGGRGGARGGARAFNNNNAEAASISNTHFPQNVPVWINPEFEELTPNQLRSIKLRLLNTVSASLIKEPRFSDGDSVTNVIKGLVKQVSFYDPEFILKVALYTRDDLGIRSAATYVVALGANLKQCQPYLRKYFNSIVRLPSDWLDIAATFQVLPDKYLEHGSLPTALRKAMVDKFPEFDVYQLGKYNKERSIKRKQKKVKKLNKEKGIEEPQKKEDKPMLTIKQMIRQLHIAKPQYNTMCILGKKYPINEDEFARLDLPGSFEPARAGKRMKLPTPETWETLLSEKGNKASTWEELIEHNKLPFMAMLRNLRNLILTGVHPKYHKWVMNKLTNERSVSSSRQFPTRFFSAYEVIPKDIDDFKAKLAAQNASPAAKPAKKGVKEQKKRKPKKVITPAYMPSANLFNEYRQALDTAVKIATVHNIKPIYGSTAVLCHSSRDMEADCASAKGLGAIKKLNEVGALLGLMCKYACEEAEFIIFSSPSAAIKEGFSKLELIEGTILDNMKVVLNKAAELGGGSEFPFDYVEELIRQRRKIDNLVVISSKLIAPGQDEMASSKTDNTVSKILKKYRQEVNPNLLFFSIDLSGRPAIFSDEEKHPNDILISGFSDSILRFIAERGDSNQLHYVENLDIAKKLVKSKEHKTPAHLEQLDKLALAEEAKKQNADLIDPGHTHTPGEWRTAKVFISSTFVDMHSERDVLTRYVFPELEERCKKRNIHLVYVDLRWGVTEEETQQNRSVQICLEEIDRCRPFFLGMISERYGWAPNDYAVDDVPQFDWVKEYPKKRSITELEVQYGYLRDTNSHGVFFLRDSSFLESVPDEYKKNFASENDEARQKIAELKQLVRQNARNGNVYDYKTIWAGFKEGKALLKGLERFRKTAVDALWSAICKEFAEEHVDVPVELDDITKERNYHLNFIHSRSRKFIGRKEIMDQLTKHVNGTQHSTIAVIGKAGSGKSALVATFAREYAKQHPNVFVLPHFIGASPRSTDIRHTLRRLCTELCHRFHIDEEIPDDYKELCQTFVSVIEQASFKGRILLIIDALDQLSKADRAHNLDWLPSSDSLPIKVIVSTLEGPCLDNLRRKKWNVPEVMVAALSVKERREIVVETLADYRKKLDEKPMNDQMRVLLKKSDSDKPLYLVLACQELRMFGVYEELTERIRTLSPTLPKLLEEILLRFEADHSKDLMKTVTCLIACSRGGLMEEEMMQLLRRKHKNEASLPRAMWARIFSTIQLFLRPLDDTGNGSLEFYHREMTRIIRKRYLEYDHEAETSIHRMLAEHFYSKVDPKGDGSFAGTDARAFSELPHHLIKAKAWKLAEKTLCSLTFIERKCALGMTFDLVCDYLEACEDGLPWKAHDRERENVDSFRHFVVGNSHILAEASHLTYQQAANQPDFTAPARIAKALGSNNKLWLKWRNKPTTHDSVQMTIKEAEAITAVAVSSYDNKIAVALKSSTVKVFNGKTGMEIASMTGHSNWITCIAFAPGGDAVTTASWDETLKIFDIGSSSEQATLTGHTRLVSSVTYSPDGKQLLSGSWDCSVRLWNAYEGTSGWIFRGHTKPVNCVAFSPDGRRIVACAWDGSLRIWDSEEHNTLIVMGGNAASLRSCRFSPNAKQIVSTGVDGNIKIWDSFAGKEITTLRGHSKAVNSCAYSSDGQQLVTGSEDHTLRVWDAILGKEITGTNWKEGWLNNVAYSSDGQYIAGGSSECFIVLYSASDLIEAGRFIGHTRAVTAVAFSPDNKLLASGADDSQIFIWDVASMQIIHRLSGHRDVICSLQFSPDGSELLTCSDDFTTRVWDVNTGETIAVLGEHTGPVKACTYSPNGKFIATAGRDSVVLLWNANTKNLLNRFTGHLDWVNALDFSPDSKRLVSASWDFNGKVWDVAKAKELSTLSGHTSALGCAKFTPDGKCIITGSFDGTLKVWDARAGTEITTLIGHERRVNGFAIAPNGQIVSVSDDGSVKVWDMLAGVELGALVGHANIVRDCTVFPETNQVVSVSEDSTIKIWNPVDVNTSKDLAGHSQRVNGCAFTSDSRFLLSASSDTTIKVWDTESGKPTKTYRGHTTPIRSIAVNSNNTQFATSSDDHLVRVWDFKTGKQISELNAHTNVVTAVAFSPANPKLLASASWDKSICIWTDNKLTSRIKFPEWVSSLAFSASGKSLIAGCYDNTASIINIQSGNAKTDLYPHTNWVTAVAFSPDEKHVLTGTYDGILKIWDLNGKELKSIVAHGKRVNSCAFSPNGKAVLSVSDDGLVSIWSVESGSKVAEFVSPSPVLSVAISPSKLIGVGDAIGRVMIHQLMGN